MRVAFKKYRLHRIPVEFRFEVLVWETFLLTCSCGTNSRADLPTSSSAGTLQTTNIFYLILFKNVCVTFALCSKHISDFQHIFSNLRFCKSKF